MDPLAQHPIRNPDSLKAEPSLSLQKAEVISVRPVRTLSRKDTAREAKQNPQVFIDRWESGPFADPPDSRVLGLAGPKLFRRSHEDLIRRMRMEGARVSQELAESRRECTLIHERHTQTWQKLHRTRNDLRECQFAMNTLQAEMDSLRSLVDDMDNMFSVTKRNRLSQAFDKGKGREISLPERAQTPDLYPLEPLLERPAG